MRFLIWTHVDANRREAARDGTRVIQVQEEQVVEVEVVEEEVVQVANLLLKEEDQPLVNTAVSSAINLGGACRNLSRLNMLAESPRFYLHRTQRPLSCVV